MSIPFSSVPLFLLDGFSCGYASKSNIFGRQIPFLAIDVVSWSNFYSSHGLFISKLNADWLKMTPPLTNPLTLYLLTNQIVCYLPRTFSRSLAKKTWNEKQVVLECSKNNSNFLVYLEFCDITSIPLYPIYICSFSILFWNA